MSISGRITFTAINLTTPKARPGPWAGALSYQSGWFLDRFSGGAVVYTSQPLYAPENRDGTLLLKPGQEGYTVFGQLYGRAKLFEDNFINIYRQAYNTPYINKNDNRMTPNTFEGYTFTGSLWRKRGCSRIQVRRRIHRQDQGA